MYARDLQVEEYYEDLGPTYDKKGKIVLRSFAAGHILYFDTIDPDPSNAKKIITQAYSDEHNWGGRCHDICKMNEQLNLTWLPKPVKFPLCPADPDAQFLVGVAQAQPSTGSAGNSRGVGIPPPPTLVPAPSQNPRPAQAQPARAIHPASTSSAAQTQATPAFVVIKDLKDRKYYVMQSGPLTFISKFFLPQGQGSSSILFSWWKRTSSPKTGKRIWQEQIPANVALTDYNTIWGTALSGNEYDETFVSGKNKIPLCPADPDRYLNTPVKNVASSGNGIAARSNKTPIPGNATSPTCKKCGRPNQLITMLNSSVYYCPNCEP